MNINYENGNQIQSGYPPNNNNNWNNNYGFRSKGVLVAKTCKDLSIAYLSLFSLAAIAAILAGVFYVLYTNALKSISVSNNDGYYSYYYDYNIVNAINSYSDAFIAMIGILIVSGIGFEIIAIALVIKVNTLENIHSSTDTLLVLFLAGLFVIFTGVAGACMVIGISNRIENQNKNNYNTFEPGPNWTKY